MFYQDTLIGYKKVDMNAAFCKFESVRIIQNILLALFFMFSLASIAQEKSKKEKSEFDIHQYKPTPKDRVVLEVNHTGWLNMPYGLRETLTSGGVNFYLFFDHPIGYSRFSFAWGAGVSSHNIHGKQKLVTHWDTITDREIMTTIEKRDEPYRVNRIGFKVVEVPIEFRFRTRTSYQFKMMIGAKFGYVVHTFTKVYDKNQKAKYFDIYGVNPFRYGVTMRIGVEQIYVTAFYALSEVFERGKGTPGVIPFSIGLAWTPRISLGSGNYIGNNSKED